MQSPAAWVVQAELHRSSGAKRRRHQDDKAGAVYGSGSRLLTAQILASDHTHLCWSGGSGLAPTACHLVHSAGQEW